MKRRDFIKVAALATVGSVALAGCAGPPSRSVESPVFAPESRPVDGEQWFASTCTMCPAACGITVRTVEGRAKKIEGNPLHPISRGKLCARGQAGLQALYHPDRTRGPLRRVGERGAGQFEPTGWAEAISEAAERLGQALSQGGAGSIVFLTGAIDGHLGGLVDRLARATGSAGRVAGVPLAPTASLEANRIAYNAQRLADYDLEGADYVLSFGANFLETWQSPVRYGRGYGALRQGRRGRRGKLVQIEPRLSLTAAAADRWIPARPGSEGALALGVAHVILAEGRQSPESSLTDADLDDWRRALAPYEPSAVADLTGVSAEEIEAVARDFAAGQSLALAGAGCGGHTNAVSTLVAVNALNLLAGNLNRPGGVRIVPPFPSEDTLQAPPTPYRDFASTLEAMRSGRTSAVVLLEVNPVFTAPAAAGARDALAKVPFVLSLSSFVDDSTAYADLVLPDHIYLERWDTRLATAGTGLAVLGTLQPVVNPVHDTRNAGDTLLAIARVMGGDVAAALPWSSFQDFPRETVGTLPAMVDGRPSAASAEEMWNEVLRQGGWWSETTVVGPSPVADPAAVAAALRFDPPRFEGDENDYPFHLHVYENVAFGDGQSAHLSWMQEMPDPLTTVVWNSWVEINPRTAAGLGLREGDVVEVESPYGKIRAPVYVFPGLMPNVVAMPLGQGHTNYGRYAERRGVNPMDILAPVVEAQAGGLAHGATRVKIAGTGERARLATIEGTSRRLPGHAGLG